MNAPLLPGRIEHWPLARLRPYAHQEWQKMRERNEALDCRVLPPLAGGLFPLRRSMSKNRGERPAARAI